MAVRSSAGVRARTSEIPGFHKLSIEERLKLIQNFANLDDEEVKILRETLRSFDELVILGSGGGEGKHIPPPGSGVNSKRLTKRRGGGC